MCRTFLSLKNFLSYIIIIYVINDLKKNEFYFYLKISININKMSIYKISSILYEILQYIDYKNLQNLQLINKFFYYTCKQYEFFISKNYINKLNKMLKMEKTLKIQIKEHFSEFPIDTFNLHMHNVLIDFGFNGPFFRSREIILISDFTYFYKNRYHRIKIYEDFTDDFSAYGDEEICKVCYSVPGFEDMFFEEIYIDRYNENNFKFLSKWMGFKDLKNFKDMFYLLWGKYYENGGNGNAYNKYSLNTEVYDNIDEDYGLSLQKINTAKYNSTLEDKNKLDNFKDKCDYWLNNLNETFNYEKELKIFKDIKQ